jgi:hypothetical protein
MRFAEEKLWRREIERELAEEKEDMSSSKPVSTGIEADGHLIRLDKLDDGFRMFLYSPGGDILNELKVEEGLARVMALFVLGVPIDHPCWLVDGETEDVVEGSRQPDGSYRISMP